MKRVLIQTTLGLIFFIPGLITAIIYLDTLKDGGKNWMLGVILPLICVGLFFLFRAGRTDMYKPDLNDDPDISQKAASESKFMENSKIISEWEKTQEMKDKMKVLQIEAAAAEQAQKDPNS